MAEQPKRLYRSRADRLLTGVLGGVAEYFGLNSSWVRIGYVLVAVLTGGIPFVLTRRVLAGVLLYVAMSFLVPAAPEAGAPEAIVEQEQAS